MDKYMPITPLPEPPSRGDSATFAQRGDAFMAALPPFAIQANELAADVTAKQGTASAAATTATEQASIATTKAGQAGAAAVSALDSKDAAALYEAAALAYKNAAGTSASNASGSEAAAAASAATVDAQGFATDYAGPAEPPVMWPFMTWTDTGNMLLKRRNAAGTAWVTQGALDPIATQAEVNAAADQDGTKFVTPKTLWGWVKQATESVFGTAKVATQAQTDAGTDDTTFVTPKKLRFGVSYVIATNGFLMLPSWLGGFIIQWGSYVNTGGSTVRNYPTPFPNAVYALIPAATNYGSSVNLNAVVIARSKLAFNINTYSGGSTTFVACEVDFICIGR